MSTSTWDEQIKRAEELASSYEYAAEVLKFYTKVVGFQTVVREQQSEETTLVFFSRAFLQPYAQYIADHSERHWSSYRQSTCPLCSGKPQVGVLRPEGYGAKRSLVCSLCSTEWDYLRILCPVCDEQRYDQLSVFTASDFEYVRVETCESCRTYLKTVDLTKNGLAVPLVDELATIPAGFMGKRAWVRKTGTEFIRNLILISILLTTCYQLGPSWGTQVFSMFWPAVEMNVTYS